MTSHELNELTNYAPDPPLTRADIRGVTSCGDERTN